MLERVSREDLTAFESDLRQGANHFTGRGGSTCKGPAVVSMIWLQLKE